MTKVLALYLPQYYETDYNNSWWGKGYTEWTACRQAKPLFNGHCQPKVPLNNNYYNLNDKDVIRQQVEIAKKYGVDGFVIYQYYSCNDNEYGDHNGLHGRMLLNKPTELIRDNEDIDIPFCLYWANHDWRKLWFGQDPTMLWAQKYGDNKEWKSFFEYNLTYFKDKRYIKIDNKPVFFIFADWHFKKMKEFMACWNKLAVENGFNGIYFIKTEDAHTSGEISDFDAVYRREPFYTFSKGNTMTSFVLRIIRTRFCRIINKFLNKIDKGIVSYTFDYDKAWKKIIDRNDYCKNVIPGAFAGWDNTARKQYNAQILIGDSPVKFKKYFKALLDKCILCDVPFIVINAWNEWAEGAYLEPDETNGYAYLEAIRDSKR